MMAIIQLKFLSHYIGIKGFAFFYKSPSDIERDGISIVSTNVQGYLREAHGI
jgi:hypothetical protein